MANWKHSIRNARRDPSNFNIVVDIVFTDDSVPPQELVDNNGGQGWPLGIVPGDEVAARLDEQARIRIKNVLEPGDLTLAAAKVIADGTPRILPEATTDLKRQAILEAEAALRKELEKAQIVRATKDNPDVQAKYDELQAAVVDSTK